MERKTPVTMGEIARELGLSRFTVSLVINNRAEERGISKRTVAKVKKELVSRGYVPSRCALGLRRGGVADIGIIHTGRFYSHLTHAFNLLCESLARTPQKVDFMLVERGLLTEGIKELLARGVRSIIWMHDANSLVKVDGPAIDSYFSRVVPVLYNYHFASERETARLSGKGYYLVGVDRTEGCRKLARMLIRLGHRKIIVPDITDPRSASMEAFREAGLETFRLSGFGRKTAANETGRLTARGVVEFMEKEGVTAACYRDDEIAGYALAEFKKLGIAVPGRLTVTGFDGLDITEAFYPPLTTVKIPVEAMVERVGEIISGRHVRLKNVFEMELIERGSHAPPAADGGGKGAGGY